MLDISKDFPTVLSKDLFSLICGEFLGYGIGREVYVYALDNTKVIKIENNAGSFQNILEWELWRDVKSNKDHSKYFAECFDISANGIYLIQERTAKPLEKEYPKLIPKFFNDTKYDNYGIVYRNNKKLFVCHDYGNMPQDSGLNTKMIKSNWWK